jgi:hypothetical protein
MAERPTWRHGARSRLQVVVAASLGRRVKRGEVFEIMLMLNVVRQKPAVAFALTFLPVLPLPLAAI